MAAFEDFQQLDIRIGTVTNAEPFPRAKTPAYKVYVDFGEEIGTKQSSAQITARYEPEDIVGRQVAAVVNFPPMNIAGFSSEILILGGMPGEDDVVLLNIDEPVPNGTKVG
ncbi:tRNA-binding protein [Salisediminibacterium halotolerans]|uniref:tRNA-binding protein n=1 Tax=Salisediminibacterium halotolerans TaxID=517425 RepID=UPI000EB2EE1D|nr:tRNA-binding protein [Salisediminibacterium halotolerans]RLJ73270.1 tRNA-binding protein [Actinophytocola xinjiangensis]RPE86692.1 tRNA-binding protein [Salisediminibacterium halotolerans]TWG34067.1 tRNA-binding protein [Salisediminibacterium halotolerans]GEL09228.1 putative chaperone CsaA [Salisediminibacterium halotolerans]